VMCDGLEITQFTYFQQAGGMELNPNTLEITYGVERLAMFLDGQNNIYDLDWGNGFTYGALRLEDERQFSVYNFEVADIDMLRNLFQQYQKEAERLLERQLYLPAYDYLLKCSQTFNILDARKAVSVAERTALMGIMRNLSARIAQKYVMQTEGEDHG